MTERKSQTRLRLVAGTHVVAPSLPTSGPWDCGDPLEFFDQIDELFQRHKDAYIAYRQAVAEVAQRTGRTVSSVGHILSAEKRRRDRERRAAEFACGEPLEGMEWDNLM